MLGKTVVGGWREVALMVVGIATLPRDGRRRKLDWRKSGGPLMMVVGGQRRTAVSALRIARVEGGGGAAGGRGG